MKDAENKVRTSITIDPELLKAVKKAAALVPQSVSAYIEAALRSYYVSDVTLDSRRDQAVREVNEYKEALSNPDSESEIIVVE